MNFWNFSIKYSSISIFAAMYAVNVTSPAQLPLVSGCRNSGDMDCQMDVQMDCHMDGQMDVQMDGPMAGQMDSQMAGQMDSQMAGLPPHWLRFTAHQEKY